MRQFRLASSIGRPFDNCLALARLILYGVLDEFPSLKLIASHLGGGICEMLGRLDYNYELQAQGYYTRAEDREPLPGATASRGGGYDVGERDLEREQFVGHVVVDQAERDDLRKPVRKFKVD